MKFGQEEGSLGITTIILLLIIILSFKIGVKSLFKSKLLFSLIPLVAWLIFASLFSYDVYLSLINGLTLILYLGSAIVSFEILNIETKISKVFLFFCIGGFISSLATLIDFFGIIHIPGVNEIKSGTNTEIGSILQASGPFARRSSMAIYFTMIITIGFLYSILMKNINKIIRLIFFLSSVVCLITLLLTHNRSGILSSFLIVSVLLFIISGSFLKKVKFISYVILGLSTLFLFIVNFLPDIWIAYQALLRIGDVSSTDTSLEDSDALRFELFKHSLSSLLNNPFGNGYGLISDLKDFDNGLIDPHNIITQIIWGAGIVGIIWIIYYAIEFISFSIPLFSKRILQNNPSKIVYVIFGALASFFIIGMMHTVISTGIAWIFFGSYLHIAKNNKSL